MHLPWRRIIRRFGLGDKRNYSDVNFEPATRAASAARGLVLADDPVKMFSIPRVGLNDKNVAAAFERLAVDPPYRAAFADEFDLVIGVPVRTGPEPGVPWNRDTETPVFPCSAATN